ncbi:MAG: helix-turn-helix transcriptional regulator [Oscillospiraceae bacterium]|nr:helix-turn-helix transcriptional regulator [Oscillospiraceae bacterium]
MTTIAQRIEVLRNERGLSRPALSAALGLSKGAVEKFETGRQTPTKEQQEKIAGYFGVSLFYLRGESSDRTRQEDWMNTSYPEEKETPIPNPVPNAKRAHEDSSDASGAMWNALLNNKQVQTALREVVLETLKSPEGQALIAKAVRRVSSEQH